LTEDHSAVGSGFGDEVVSPEEVAPPAWDRLTASMMIQTTLRREERAACSVAVATGAAFAMGASRRGFGREGEHEGRRGVTGKIGIAFFRSSYFP